MTIFGDHPKWRRWAEELKMCLAEAGYDPGAVRARPDGGYGIQVGPADDIDEGVPWVPREVAERAMRLVTGRTGQYVHIEGKTEPA